MGYSVLTIIGISKWASTAITIVFRYYLDIIIIRYYLDVVFNYA